MATGLAKKPAEATEPTTGRDGANLYRLTVAQYLRMIDAGVFDGGPAVELLGGLLVEKMTKNDPHNLGVDELADRIGRLLPGGWIVRQEKSIVLDGRSRPEPDVVVARGPRRRYRDHAPTPKEIALIVEVADSTYREDRGDKWARYAAAKIPCYGILNIQERRFEAYSRPCGRGESARYRESTTYEQDAEFPVIFEGRELGRIAVRDGLD